MRACARLRDASGSFEVRERARYDATTVAAPPRMETAIDVCDVQKLVTIHYKKRGCFYAYIFTAQCSTHGCSQRTKKNLEAYGDVEKQLRLSCYTMRTNKRSVHIAIVIDVSLLLTCHLGFLALFLGFNNRRVQSCTDHLWVAELIGGGSRVSRPRGNINGLRRTHRRFLLILVIVFSPPNCLAIFVMGGRATGDVTTWQ